ncbi:MAG: tRNA (uridine(34)/cytosine(34)/5-carboxymethylaminomethyluridine(34)-2'-O)-methyltransferase TrmL [Ruminococcaceae bacterium]|nr:tRNA (uridine(34)/cytosine(34)/5-carboxymethylaminomethyluridine(34)-2'-O)-methyltransferase TrmL [Oscillospiraceae bacterium]
MFNLVLLAPEIPSNTGNIVRTCAATGCSLHLIRPLGFDTSDRELKRAGLDYWHFVDITIYDSLEDFYVKCRPKRCWYTSTKAARRYTDVSYEPGDYIFFGRETRGLPEELILKNLDHAIRIPMGGEIRSLNLSNSAAIVLFEALRQHDFTGLQDEGKFGGNYGQTR